MIWNATTISIITTQGGSPITTTKSISGSAASLEFLGGWIKSHLSYSSSITQASKIQILRPFFLHQQTNIPKKIYFFHFQIAHMSVLLCVYLYMGAWKLRCTQCFLSLVTRFAPGNAQNKSCLIPSCSC